MKKMKISALLFVGLLSFVACNKEENYELAFPYIDGNFIVAVSDLGKFNGQYAQLASSRGVSSSVKTFGQGVTTDYSAANQELSAIADKYDIQLASGLTNTRRQTFDRLDTLNKKMSFDSAYVVNVIEANKNAVAIYQDEIDNGSNADLKAFAAKRLPIVTQNLTRIMAIKDELKIK